MKFDFVKELTSGQCTIYGQCILGLFTPAYERLQGIIDLAVGCVIILLEIPIFLKCVPSSPKFDEIIKFFEKNSMRACLYAGIAVVNWFFEIKSFSGFVIPTVTITGSAISYGIATFKNEERVTSSLTGTSNIIDLATRV
ncbi:hypothetical protein PIROE2DRAFT_15675 [Piromyces sp. E2]|nr:hypothetical protein PIROE2DRAFT_15675 [Piromyces sp. E2]|eukprot:OUM58940.1 hypothetical protein PIROE2DRAFT_15675 [Piromyces sp. E2]